MICKKCGNKNENNKKFCTECGNKLINEKESKSINAEINKKSSAGKKVGDVFRYIIGGFLVLSGLLAFDLSGLFIGLSGLLTMPFLYDILRKKVKNINKGLLIFLQIFLPIVFFIIFSLIVPKEYIIEKDNKCEVKDKFKSSTGTVYYYCIKDLKLNNNGNYESLNKVYLNDKSVLTELENTFTKIEYEDKSILYSCEYYNMLKCSNGDIYIGDNSMKYNDGFCGVDKAPLVKGNSKNKSKKESLEKDEEKRKIYKEIKGYFYIHDSLKKIDRKAGKFIVTLETDYSKGSVSSNPDSTDVVEHMMDIINNIKNNKPEIDQNILEYKWIIKSNTINTKTSYLNTGENVVSQITLKVDGTDVTVTKQNIIDKQNVARENAAKREQEEAARKVQEQAEKRKKDTTVVHNVGETVKCPNFDITINSFQIKKQGTYIDSYFYIDDPEWIGVILTATNTSSDTHTFYSSDVTLQNSTGEIISHKFWNYDIWGAEMLNSPKLISKGTKTGYISFANTNQDDSNLVLIVSCNDHLIAEDTTYKFQLR